MFTLLHACLSEESSTIATGTELLLFPRATLLSNTLHYLLPYSLNLTMTYTKMPCPMPPSGKIRCIT